MCGSVGAGSGHTHARTCGALVPVRVLPRVAEHHGVLMNSAESASAANVLTSQMDFRRAQAVAVHAGGVRRLPIVLRGRSRPGAPARASCTCAPVLPCTCTWVPAPVALNARGMRPGRLRLVVLTPGVVLNAVLRRGRRVRDDHRP